MLVSCESRDDKFSRLKIDVYANKISSILGNIAESKVEEETRTQPTFNDFYGVYVIKVEEFINDLNLEKISPLYIPYKDSLLLSAEGLNCYLDYRKDAVANMTMALSNYESAVKSKSDCEEYVILKNSSFSESDFYADLVRKSLEEYKTKTLEFNISKNSYLKNIQKMDSIYLLIDSIAIEYNHRVIDSKLEEKITVPLTFRDTINDWLISSQSYLQELMVPSVELSY
jgi:hypothetical protein